MMAERPAYVTISTLLCPKGVVVELKREVVEGKGGKEVAGWPPFFGRSTMFFLDSIPTFILHFILLLSCSLN
jgi:hypothetical protein